MTGYMLAYGHCVACGAPIAFSPSRVPSITVDGEREPLCRACFERWKQIHDRPDLRLLPGAYEPEEC